MRRRLFALCPVLTFAVIVSSAQDRGELRLAQRLADDSSRQAAVDEIVASRQNELRVLISWTVRPPDQVDRRGLYIGLADAFGGLRAKDAIPFLIKNIDLKRRAYEITPWNRAPAAVEESLPAVAALIQIGPDASKALMQSYSEPKGIGDRLFLIFAVSRIASSMSDPREERVFLAAAAGEANSEHYWAEQGLKALDGSH